MTKKDGKKAYERAIADIWNHIRDYWQSKEDRRHIIRRHEDRRSMNKPLSTMRDRRNYSRRVENRKGRRSDDYQPISQP